MTSSALAEERKRFHSLLVSSGALVVNAQGVASNADKDNRSSREFAKSIADALEVEAVGERLAGQTSGDKFEHAVQKFLQATFPLFHALRPGQWEIDNLGGRRSAAELARYEPYTHLDELAAAIKRDPTLTAVLGNAYLISPDVVVSRHPEPDEVINAEDRLVDEEVARRTAIRRVNNDHLIAHAVVSCKWTLRSDRAQNARSEALNLIRNRKGRLPHVVVVTAEPTPSRLSSLALGTGDIDCVYHFALPELEGAVTASGNDEAIQMLLNMTKGRRLKDIADLPLDLTV